jgi:hypothetical protein
MTDVELNWASAEVEGGKLTVELEGKISSGWKQSFEKTVRLLAGGDWGKVQVKKQAVRVGDVTAGSEDKLRHHLEGLVEQANASVRPRESDSEDGAAGKSGRDSADARMTESFRAFAQDPEAKGQ